MTFQRTWASTMGKSGGFKKETTDKVTSDMYVNNKYDKLIIVDVSVCGFDHNLMYDS